MYPEIYSAVYDFGICPKNIVRCNLAVNAFSFQSSEQAENSSKQMQNVANIFILFILTRALTAFARQGSIPTE